MGGFGHDLKRKILGNNAHAHRDRRQRASAAVRLWANLADAIATSLGARALASPGGGGDAGRAGEAMASSLEHGGRAGLAGSIPTASARSSTSWKNIEVGKFDYLAEPEKV